MRPGETLFRVSAAQGRRQFCRRNLGNSFRSVQHTKTTDSTLTGLGKLFHRRSAVETREDLLLVRKTKSTVRSVLQVPRHEKRLNASTKVGEIISSKPMNGGMDTNKSKPKGYEQVQTKLSKRKHTSNQEAINRQEQG